jgi:hypothetical protein
VFATDAATTRISAGLYQYTLAPQSNLELFKFKWKGTFGGVVQYWTEDVEIVGGFYVSLAEIRALTGITAEITDASLEKARGWFEDLAELSCGRAFVPRFARDLLDGDGTDNIRLDHIEPRTILSAKIGGVAQTGTATWALYPTGRVVRDTGSFTGGSRNVEIQYEYGADEPDDELHEATLRAIQYRLLGDKLGLPAEAISASVDVRGPLTIGTPFQQAAGMGRPTGIPEIDHVLSARSMAVYVG